MADNGACHHGKIRLRFVPPRGGSPAQGEGAAQQPGADALAAKLQSHQLTDPSTDGGTDAGDGHENAGEQGDGAPNAGGAAGAEDPMLEDDGLDDVGKEGNGLSLDTEVGALAKVLRRIARAGKLQKVLDTAGIELLGEAEGRDESNSPTPPPDDQADIKRYIEERMGKGGLERFVEAQRQQFDRLEEARLEKNRKVGVAKGMGLAKLQAPSRFSGAGKQPEVGADVECFLERMRDYLRLGGTDPSLWEAVARTYLTGPADEWYTLVRRAEMAATSTEVSWEFFSKSLRDKYVAATQGADEVQNFLAGGWLGPGVEKLYKLGTAGPAKIDLRETFHLFNAGVDKVKAAFGGEITSPKLLEAILRRALPQAIRNAVREVKIEGLEAFQAHCLGRQQELENLAAMGVVSAGGAISSGAKRPAVATGQQAGSQGAGGSGTGSGSGSQQGRQAGPSTPGGGQQQGQGKQPFKCFKCGSPEHKAKECPKRAKQDAPK
jgi:hypothetical protein